MPFSALKSLIAAALIGLTVGGAIDTKAQPTPQAQHAEQSGAGPNGQAKQDKVAKPFGEMLAVILNKTWDDPVAFFTFILAVFTGVLGVSTIGLWIVTAKGIRNQARDMQILERAYLSVEPGGTEQTVADRPDRVAAKIVIRNVGHLPARNVRFSGAVGRPEGDEFPLSDLFPGKIVLAPGTASTQAVATIFPRDVGNFTFVWGIVTYDDGFGRARFTRFCHRYRTKAFLGTIFELPGEAAEIHEYGNDAD